ADLILQAWQRDQVAVLQSGGAQTLLTPDSRIAAPADGSLQAAVNRVLAVAPGMEADMIAFPGTLRATPQHFAVMLRGDTPLTSRMTRAVLVDPDSGEVLEAAGRPCYVTAFMLSEPLHFGDYGGLPMKILWGLLDVLTIIVLTSGLVLWWRKREKSPAEAIDA